jgi:hypothetical protein
MCARRTIICLAAMSVLLSGCATSQSQFVGKSQSLDDTEVCRNYLKDEIKLRWSYQAEDAGERKYVEALRTQTEQRNLSVSSCEAKVSSADDKIAGDILLGVVAVGAAVVGAKNGAFSRGYWSPYFVGSKFVLGLINDPYGGASWRCRNELKGQVTYKQNCGDIYGNGGNRPGT